MDTDHSGGRLKAGDPAALLHVLHFALLEFSTHLAIVVSSKVRARK
jgi:hypothetical protein